MSWLKVDDGFNTHPKVCRIDEEFSPLIAMNARAVWLTIGVFCAHARAPFVEVGPLRKLLPCSRADLDDAIRALVAVGLLDETDAGLEVHDWGHYVPPSSTERVKEHRERKRVKQSETVTPVSETVTRVTGNVETLPLPSPPLPTQPDPTQPLGSSLRSEPCHADKPRDDSADEIETPKEPTSKRGRERREMAKRIFAFWQSELDHPRVALTDDRLRKIEARLRELESAHDPGDPETDPETVCRVAVIGVTQSRWHMGENDEGKRHDGIKVVFRDADQVDKFYNLGAEEVAKRERKRIAEERPIIVAAPKPEEPKYERTYEQLCEFYEIKALDGATKIERLRAYVEQFPDDSEARFLLAAVEL